MPRPVRRSPSAHSLDPGPAAARLRVRCPDCGARCSVPASKRPGAPPPKPRCLACGFLSAVADAGVREAMHGALRRIEALDSAGLLGPAPPERPSADDADEPSRCPSPSATGDALGTAQDVCGRDRARRGSRVVIQARAHLRAAKTHVKSAKVHAAAASTHGRAVAAHIERTRARMERFRSRTPETRAPN